MTTLRATITELASTFASSVLDAIRGMSLDEILRETQGGGASRARPAAAAAQSSARPDGRKRARSGKAGRLERRSANDIAEVVDRIVSLLERRPSGMRAEEIRKELGLQAKELPRPITEALASKRISKSGQKRATTYFAKGHGAKAQSAKSAKASKPGRARAKARPKRAAKKAKKKASPQPKKAARKPAKKAAAPKKSEAAPAKPAAAEGATGTSRASEST